jgi:hypothetical protein
MELLLWQVQQFLLLIELFLLLKNLIQDSWGWWNFLVAGGAVIGADGPVVVPFNSF